MAKGKFERTKPHCNIGTIGHVDHGKTTLTAAIATRQSTKGMGEAKKYDEIDEVDEFYIPNDELPIDSHCRPTIWNSLHFPVCNVLHEIVVDYTTDKYLG